MNTEDRKMKAAALEMTIPEKHKVVMLGILGAQRVPDDLVLEFFAVKSYTDKMSIAMSPMDIFYMCRRCDLIVDPFALTGEAGKPEPIKSVVAIAKPKTQTQPVTTDVSRGEAVVTTTTEVEKKPESVDSEPTVGDLWPDGAHVKGTPCQVFHDKGVEIGTIAKADSDEFGISYGIKMEKEIFTELIWKPAKDVQVECDQVE